jgi:hypothetical protein
VNDEPAGGVTATRPTPARPDRRPVEISVIMPCLNEEEAVGACVRAAREGLDRTGLRGEVLVVDNGSTDRSAAVAAAAGARVVTETRRGYGNAYLAGFAAARGPLMVMGDADSSYDFTQLDRLVAPLLAGEADYVLGSRFGGRILPGAMPWLHQYIGNPVLTAILNRLFGVRSSDAHSGMRAFTRAGYARMGLRSEGMELASEIVIAAARAGLRCVEVPITYHPRIGASKLQSLRDGWRHLRFMLLLAPRHLFVLPGVALLGGGLLAQLVLLLAGVGGPDPAVLPDGVGHGVGAAVDGMGWPDRFGPYGAAIAAAGAVIGGQLIMLGVLADMHNQDIGWGSTARWPLPAARRLMHPDRGPRLGGALAIGGLVATVVAVLRGLGDDERATAGLLAALLALTVLVLGVQTAMGSLYLRLVTTVPSGGRRQPTAPTAPDENAGLDLATSPPPSSTATPTATPPATTPATTPGSPPSSAPPPLDPPTPPGRQPTPAAGRR